MNKVQKAVRAVKKLGIKKAVKTAYLRRAAKTAHFQSGVEAYKKAKKEIYLHPIMQYAEASGIRKALGKARRQTKDIYLKELEKLSKEIMGRDAAIAWAVPVAAAGAGLAYKDSKRRKK